MGLYPFVHRFKTENNNYVYDVHTGEIVQVGEAVFEVIESYNEAEEDLLIKRFSGRFDPEVLREAFSAIKKAKEDNKLFRSDHPQHKISSFPLDVLERAINRDLQVLTLGITESCNLSCSYCTYSGRYEGRRVHSSKEMDLLTAKKGVDYLRQHNIPDIRPPAIGFYGGEPLLKFSLIKEVVEYAKRLFSQDRLGFTITTNGTILTDEMLDFFEKNHFYLILSLDGPQGYHDGKRTFKNGRGSWDIVIKNVKHIKERYPELYYHRLMISVTMSPPTNYKELDGFFSQIGVTQRVNVVEPTCQSDIKSYELFADYDYVLDKFKNMVTLGHIGERESHPEGLFVYELFNEAMRKIHKRKDYPFRLGEPTKHGLCIPGGFKLFVGADGTLFPCEKLEGYTNMQIGHIGTGVEIKRVQKLMDDFSALNWRDCQNCWIVRFCSCCLLHPQVGGELRNEKLKAMCKLWRKHYDRMIRAYCSIMEKNQDAFSYLEEKEVSLVPEICND